MRVLIDTNVLAELARPRCNPAVSAAFAAIPIADVFISALTVGEIVKGVSLLGSGPKKIHLAGWLDGLENLYAERILPIDTETARIWGELTARPENRDRRSPDRRPARGLRHTPRAPCDDSQHETLPSERSPHHRPVVNRISLKTNPRNHPAS